MSGSWKKMSAGLPLVVLLAGGSLFLAKVSLEYASVGWLGVCAISIIRYRPTVYTHPLHFTATQQFVQGRVEAKDRKIQSRSEREFSIEEEHRQMMAKLQPDRNYKIVRIHRPEEEDEKGS